MFDDGRPALNNWTRYARSGHISHINWQLCANFCLRDIKREKEKTKTKWNKLPIAQCSKAMLQEDRNACYCLLTVTIFELAKKTPTTATTKKWKIFDARRQLVCAFSICTIDMTRPHQFNGFHRCAYFRIFCGNYRTYRPQVDHNMIASFDSATEFHSSILFRGRFRSASSSIPSLHCLKVCGMLCRAIFKCDTRNRLPKIILYWDL